MVETVFYISVHHQMLDWHQNGLLKCSQISCEEKRLSRYLIVVGVNVKVGWEELNPDRNSQ